MLPARAPRSSPKRVRDEALKLNPDQRLKLADLLYASLDTPDPAVAAAWEKEIARRIKDVESGAVQPIAWSTARRQIFAPRRKEKR